MLNRQFDDAVTAYHNGALCLSCGLSADYVEGLRAGYIAGMTWEVSPDTVPHTLNDRLAGMSDGLEDALADRAALS